MRNKIIAGNWKMNGKKQEIIELTKQLKEGLNFTSDLSKAPQTHGAPHHQMTSDASNPPSALHLKNAFSPCLGSREQEGGYLEANKTRNQHQQQINSENPHVPHVLTASSHEQAEVKTNKRALEVVIMPPALYIPLVSDLLSQSSIQVGAQNVFPKDAGAYTGELSAPMLKEYHCAYVLVGHSERRQYFHEDENFVAEKFHHVKEHGMIPVLCVGETLTERENGLTDQVITRQLLAVYEKNDDCFHNSVIAYEPVWAIGTGKSALPEQAQAVHYFIRNLVSKINRNDAEHLTLLYGGSVNENNARALFSMPDIDGGLVGGASLNAKQFLEIVKCIN